MITEKEIEKEVKAAMRKCQSFAKREYGITRKCKLVLNTTRWCASHQLGDTITIYTHPYTVRRENGLFRFSEYKAIKDQSAIGSFESDNWKLCVRAIVAHEFAHFMQDRMRARGNKSMRKPHGEGWRNIYADLRWLIVNRDLREEKAAA